MLQILKERGVTKMGADISRMHNFDSLYTTITLLSVTILWVSIVRTLKLGRLEEDWPITAFCKSKRFSSVFANRPKTFINLRTVS